MLVFAGCKKDDKKKSQKDYLIAHTWRAEQYFLNGVEQTLDPCEKDDTYSFASSGSFTYNNNTKCDPSDLETISGTWTLDNNVIIINVFGLTQNLTIVSINDTRLETTTTDGTDVEKQVFIAQ